MLNTIKYRWRHLGYVYFISGHPIDLRPSWQQSSLWFCAVSESIERSLFHLLSYLQNCELVVSQIKTNACASASAIHFKMWFAQSSMPDRPGVTECWYSTVCGLHSSPEPWWPHVLSALLPLHSLYRLRHSTIPLIQLCRAFFSTRNRKTHSFTEKTFHYCSMTECGRWWEETIQHFWHH